jgi:hypothetical protein
MIVLRVNRDGSYDVSYKRSSQDMRQAHTVVHGHVDAVLVDVDDPSNTLVGINELADVWRRHLRERR